jgi:hypothetical protein
VSAQLVASSLYSRITIKSVGSQVGDSALKMKRPSPADPLDLFRRSGRYKIACNRKGDWERSSLPFTRGQASRINEVMPVRAGTTSPAIVRSVAKVASQVSTKSLGFSAPAILVMSDPNDHNPF